jgi:hypothetical protein
MRIREPGRRGALPGSFLFRRPGFPTCAAATRLITQPFESRRGVSFLCRYRSAFGATVGSRAQIVATVAAHAFSGATPHDFSNNLNDRQRGKNGEQKKQARMNRVKCADAAWINAVSVPGSEPTRRRGGNCRQNRPLPPPLTAMKRRYFRLGRRKSAHLPATARGRQFPVAHNGLVLHIFDHPRRRIRRMADGLHHHLNQEETTQQPGDKECRTADGEKSGEVNSERRRIGISTFQCQPPHKAI